MLAWFFVRWNLANVIASQIDPRRPEAPLLADWLTGFAPDDPMTHLLAGTVYERTFEPGDLERAVFEFETAAALSPENYLMWMNLGKARSFAGDTEGAFAAYRRALALAPNYASIQWVFGNALIREGETGEGFALIAKSAAANPDYLTPGIATALQAFEGDVGQVRSAMGNTGNVNAGLVSVLASAKRFDEAFEAWGQISLDDKQLEFRSLGERLVSQMTEAGKFRMAVGIQADITEAEKPAVATITNGGFEAPVKPRNAGIFEWRISEGTHPQIGLSDGLKRSGQYSLMLLFSSFETAGLRTIDQTVAVDPAAEHELEIFYRSDIKSKATLRWEIVDAYSSTRIAVSEPLIPAADWTAMRIVFRSPEASDAVQLRLIREGCVGPACPMNGRISFDDISLRKL